MYMNMEEIREKYNGQWVYLINCEESKRGKIMGGEVVLYSENRDDVFRDMEKYDHEPSLTYLRYVGVIPESESFLL